MSKKALLLSILVASVSVLSFLAYDFQSSTDEPALKPEKVNHESIYIADVKPILETRCVVCHACYDAPCQLKLGSYEGIQRGASKDVVYDGERFLEANLTRLFEDAHSVEEWREKGFFSVLSESTENDESPEPSALIAKMLTLKQENPLPATKLLPDSIELDINHEYQCASNDEFDEFQQDYPLHGMPYGLPKISSEKHKQLIDWINNGAAGNDKFVIDSDTQKKIDEWEQFFNGDSTKEQLVSRYIFEHLFLVNLHFGEEQDKQYFKLVRSATAPGDPIEGIYTRRPFDDPEVDRVFYRFKPVLGSIVHKAHLPMRLDQNRMKKWKNWFLDQQYEVTELPSYESEKASNPFVTFAQLPVRSRYKYMLDEAQNTIMQFIKGPVCRGQIALNVINDHFWVVFLDPDQDLVDSDNGLMQQARQKILLPAEEESSALPTSWIEYAEMERDYLEAKAMYVKQKLQEDIAVDLNLLWDGYGENDNASLTVFRHFDAASVVKGLVGDAPQTAWVLSYPLFERIHYLLVAGYDVYGNLGHQLNSRIYMDFLRMEGEYNFLALLPPESRKKVREKWYRGSVSEVEKFVYEANEHGSRTDINYETNDHLSELLAKIKDYLAEVNSQRHELSNTFSNPSTIGLLNAINRKTGVGASIFPQSSILQVYEQNSGVTHYFTLLRHSAHSNISHLFSENDRRLPEEDTMTIGSGLMTSHPNAFMQVSIAELPEFTNAINDLSSAQDYTVFMDKYGVRRTDPDFWEFADNMHRYYKQNYPVEFGLLDFNRLENR